jgi:hypothetical protein
MTDFDGDGSAGKISESHILSISILFSFSANNPIGRNNKERNEGNNNLVDFKSAVTNRERAALPSERRIIE